LLGNEEDTREKEKGKRKKEKGKSRDAIYRVLIRYKIQGARYKGDKVSMPK